jgi:hypothetical protein
LRLASRVPHDDRPAACDAVTLPGVTRSRCQDRAYYSPTRQYRSCADPPQLVDVADLASRHDMLRRHQAGRERYAVILIDDQGQKTGATRPLDRRPPIYFDDFASFMTQYRAASHGSVPKSHNGAALRGAAPPGGVHRSTVNRRSVTTSPRCLLLGYDVTSAITAVAVPTVDPTRTRAPQSGSSSGHRARLA